MAVNANTTFCITGIELTATCDDVIHVFADGVDVTTTSGSTTYNDVNSVEHHVLSTTTQVIGIKCENTAGVGGILASIDSDGITDTRHWKCSHAAGSGWSEFGIAYNIYVYKLNVRQFGTRPCYGSTGGFKLKHDMILVAQDMTTALGR